MSKAYPPFFQDPLVSPIDSSVFSLFESFPEPVFIMDPTGVILKGNAALAARFSMRPEECLGSNVYDLLSGVLQKPEIAELRRQKAQEVLQTGKAHIFDDKHDGQTYRSTVFPIRSSEGQVTHLFVFAQDITDIADLAQKARLFNKNIITAIPGTFFVLDADGKFIAWNDRMREMNCSRSEPEMLESFVTESVHPDDRAGLIGQLQDVMHTGQEQGCEFRVMLQEKKAEKWYLITVNRVMLGGNLFLIGVEVDITERKQNDGIAAFRTQLLSQVAVESVEKLLLTTVNEAERLTRSRIGVCHIIEGELAASSMQVLSTNLLRNMREHAVPDGHPHPSMHKGTFWAEVISEKSAVINNNCNTEAERTSRPHNHPGVLRKLVVPLIRDEKVIAVIGVGNKPEDYDENDSRIIALLADLAWDIVAKKHAENEQKKLYEQLLHSQKMEMVGQLAGGIAHDFNNMLAIILGHAEIGLEKADAAHADLEVILRAAHRSAEIIRQLLSFARKQQISPKVVTLNTVITEIIPMLRRLLGEQIAIDWKPDNLNRQVKIDPMQVGQILVNLCVNARDAIDGDGVIAIETSLHSVIDIKSNDQQPCTTPGEYIMLAVTDNGEGICADVLPHIFEPFFTTKEVGKGTGLGLSTVYGIARQNHGFVDCHSKPGGDTAVRVFFPAFVERVSKIQKDQLSLHLNDGKGKILIVDDEPNILSLCQSILERAGFTVITASSPNEAIRLVEEYTGSVELLLTDVVIPGMNGVELSRKLQSLNPELKTLFMSAYTPDYISRFGGINDKICFLQKPFTPAMLVDKIRPMLPYRAV